jgi:uncharacterized protein (TIGR02231 family)
VYTSGARITRRGPLSIPPGTHTVTFENLSPDLEADSVRIGGDLTGARLLDVQVTTNYSEVADPRIETLRAELQLARDALATTRAAIAQATIRSQFINQFAMSSAQRLGKRSADPLAVEDARRIGAAVESDLREVDGRLVSLRAAEILGAERVSAAEAALANAQPVGTYGSHVSVTLEHEAVADSGAEPPQGVLELSYLVSGASWHPVHDVALSDSDVTVRSFGMISQTSGEAWNDVTLAVSTAEPWRGIDIPEPEPWIIRRRRPMPPMPVAGAAVMARSAPMAASMKGVEPEVAFAAADESYAPMAEDATTTTRLEGSTEYRASSKATIPPDGTSRRVFLGDGEFAASLARVATVYASTEVALRAEITNQSELVVMAGEASIFHGDRFVGRTFLDALAPGETAELALGIDENIRIERKLVRKDASKSLVGSTRSTATTYATELANHGTEPIELIVRDRAPHSEDAEITVKVDRLQPANAEIDGVGRVEWRLGLDPGQTAKLELGWVVSRGKDVDILGLD